MYYNNNLSHADPSLYGMYDSIVFEAIPKYATNNQLSEMLNIMMIDDNPKDIELFEELLRVEGNISFNLSKWTKCSNALKYLDQGIEMYHEAMPHIIIVDLVMPEMNGKMVLKKLKELSKTKNIPVVVYSSSNSYENVIDVDKLSASAFFQKPLNVEEFLDFLKERFKL